MSLGRVRHDQLGHGDVVRVERVGGKVSELSVLLDDSGELRRFAIGYARDCLEIVDGLAPFTDPWWIQDPDVAAANFQLEVVERAHDMRITDAARRLLAREQLGNPPRPQLVRLDDFLAQPDTDPTYRIDRVWPTGGRVLLAAQAKAGKTTLLGNAIRSLVDGDRFLGRYDTAAAARVLLIDDELDPRTLRRWLAAQGIANTAAVRLLALRGRIAAFDIIDPPTRATWATQLAGADVIILDCLRPILDAFGLDENREAGRFLVAFDALLAESGATEAIVTHHMGHGAERARGDSRLTDWPDAIWKLVRDKDETDPTLDDVTGLRYFSAYGRDVDEPQAELTFDPTNRHLSIGLLAGNRKEAVERRKHGRAEEIVLEAIASVPGMTKRQLRAACDIRNTEVDRAIARLVVHRRIDLKVVGSSHHHYPVSAVSDGVPDAADTGVSRASRGTDASPSTLEGLDMLDTDTPTAEPRLCENCGEVDVPPGFKWCNDCSAAIQALAKGTAS